MKIRNSISAAEARQKMGIDAARSTPAPSVNFEPKPSTDEEKLNKTERAWLEVLRRRASVVGIQDVTLKLGADLRYTCDFNAIIDGRWTFYEVKGFFRDDARVKLLAVARKYPHLDFVLVTKEKGQWVETAVKP